MTLPLVEGCSSDIHFTFPISVLEQQTLNLSSPRAAMFVRVVTFQLSFPNFN